MAYSNKVNDFLFFVVVVDVPYKYLICRLFSFDCFDKDHIYISFIPRVTELSLSKSCHSGLFTSRNLFVLKIFDKVAAVADMITTTGQKLEAGLNQSIVTAFTVWFRVGQIV